MSDRQPTIIIILGGAGDLAQQKLLPSLFDLYIQGDLPDFFTVIGLARTQRTNTEYQLLVKDAVIHKAPAADTARLDAFCKQFAYVSGSFVDEQSYADLAMLIKDTEDAQQTATNRLFYLAVPPEHYETIFKQLHASELANQAKLDACWARILVEKPFGKDYQTAVALDSILSSLYAEDQIFRIDHYLAKEAVQNILSFRFANTLLRSPWNREHIKEIRITMHESRDASARGSFYDEVGALRDVGQNHLLQLLALIAMDEPDNCNAHDIRTNRAAILEKLVPVTSDTAASHIVRAQYDGYKDTAGVHASSTTETYFEFKTYIDSDAWQGVPFYVSAGKALAESKVCIEVVFFDVATGPFEKDEYASEENRILLTISPKQSMHITLNVKRPGFGYQIEPHTLSYAWDDSEQKNDSAYEKVLLDCFVGDQTLFTKTEEVLASWKFITSVMENWENVPLQSYTIGSSGPDHTLTSSK